MNVRVQESFQKLNKALQAIIDKPIDPDRIAIDACIQRFEFTIELFWKLLKRIIEPRGLEVVYPKDVLQEAYAGKLIDDEYMWLEMLKDRNLTFHTYDENLADTIYVRIQRYYPVMQINFNNLFDKFGNS